MTGCVFTTSSRSARMLRRLVLLVPLALLASSPSGCVGCGGDPDPRGAAEALGFRYPSHAARVLSASSSFVETEEGFAAAHEPLVAASRKLHASLPREGQGFVRFELPSGFAVRVRERG